MGRLIDGLRGRSGMLAGMGAVLVGNGAAAAFGFAVLFILTRALGASEFGRLAPVLSLIDVGVLLIDMAFNAGFVQAAARLSAQSRSPALKAGFLMKSLLAAIVTILAAAGAPLLVADVPPALAFSAALTIAPLALYTFMIAVLQIEQRFRLLAVATVAKNVLRAIALAALAAAGLLTVDTAAMAIIAGGFIAAGGVALCIGWRFLADRTPMRPLATEMLSINVWMAVAGLGHVAGRCDVFLLAMLSSDEETGWYAAAVQLSIVVGIVGQAVVTTLAPRVATLTDRDAIRRYVGQCLRFWPVAIVAFAAMAAPAPWVIPLVLGSDFEPAVPTFLVAFASAVMTLLINPLILAFLPLASTRSFALASLATLILRLAFAAMLIPGWGALGAAIADIASKTLGIGALLVLLSRRLRQT